MRGVLPALVVVCAVSLTVVTSDPAAASDGFSARAFRHGGHLRLHGPKFRHHGSHFRHHGPIFRHGGGDHRFVHPGKGFRDDDHGHKHRFSKHFPFTYDAGTVYPNNVIVIEQSQPTASPMTRGIPSLADLPASTGIRSQATDSSASPVIYVVTGGGASGSLGRGSRRSVGAKILSAGPEDVRDVPADLPGSGPRIIHIDVPRGP